MKIFILDIKNVVLYCFSMETLKKLLKKYKTKKDVAERLDITVRHIDMILKGDRKPGKHLLKIMKMHL